MNQDAAVSWHHRNSFVLKTLRQPTDMIEWLGGVTNNLFLILEFYVSYLSRVGCDGYLQMF